MAKRKHAAALFEVFNDQKSSLRSQSATRGYGWWFKGRNQGAEAEEPQVVDANDPTTMTIRSPLLAPRIAAVEAMEPAAPAPKPTPAPKPAPAAKLVETPRPAPVVAERDPLDQVRESLAKMRDRSSYIADSSDSPTSRFHIDRTTRELSLRLPLNYAMIGAFGLFLSLGVAYVTGRHIGHNEARAVANADTSLAAQQPTGDDQRPADQHSTELRPSALDVHRPSRSTTPIAAPVKPTYHPPVADDTRYHDRDSLPQANSTNGITPVARPVTAPVDGPRIIGLNYLLVQNYPNKESAIEARDFLLQSGIDCTVEKVPAGFFCPDPNWMSVITNRGFSREEMHTPEYDAFKKRIEKVSDKFAGNGKFKRFAILPYQLK